MNLNLNKEQIELLKCSLDDIITKIFNEIKNYELKLDRSDPGSHLYNEMTSMKDFHIKHYNELSQILQKIKQIKYESILSGK